MIQDKVLSSLRKNSQSMSRGGFSVVSLRAWKLAIAGPAVYWYFPIFFVLLSTSTAVSPAGISALFVVMMLSAAWGFLLNDLFDRDIDSVEGRSDSSHGHTLSYFGNQEGTKKAIASGIKYLLSRYSRNHFHSELRWIDSDIPETALSVIALLRGGYTGTERDSSIEWLCSRQPYCAEEAAHIMWALSEARKMKDSAGQLARFIIQRQNFDGSWIPSLPLDPETSHYDQIFSSAMPLFALKKYATAFSG